MPKEVKEKEHIHSWRKIKHPTMKIFVCMDSKCTSRESLEYLVGKTAICPYCARLFVLNRKDLNRKVIQHCEFCTKGREHSQNKPPEVKNPYPSPYRPPNEEGKVMNQLDEKLKEIL